MTKRNKQALGILLVSIPSFGLGVWQFGIGGATSSFVAIATSIAVTLGGAGILVGLTMLFTNRLGWFDDDLMLETIFKKEKKEMTKIKKEPVVEQKPINKHASESIQLMKREENLVKRSDELNALVSELEAELNQVRESLEIKGWVLSENGWVVG
tara:strand:- start:255 stop:719 length:465 start_codon:yes stop_codon:yes gene_type:complete